MSNIGSRSISLRSSVMGEAVAFLSEQDMSCVITQDGITELISELSDYQEEGKSLFPEIFIIDDLEIVKKILPTHQHQFIGSGPKSKETMLKALKKCAPLSVGGWSIYILRLNESFEFGLLRAGTSLISMPISEVLIDNGSSIVKAFVIHQLSSGTVELKGINGHPSIINFGVREELRTSPLENISNFVKKIANNAPIEIKEPLVIFLKKIFLYTLQNGHGTLACVIPHRKSIPKFLTDGSAFGKRIDIAGAILDLHSAQSVESNSKLEGLFNLVSGMMQSDGITVYTDKGEVAAFNVFIKHSKSSFSTTGGARSRTYLTLCEHIPQNLLSAYIQSQDGKIQFA